MPWGWLEKPWGLLAAALEGRPKKLWAWEAPWAVGEATHLPDLDIILDGCSTPKPAHLRGEDNAERLAATTKQQRCVRAAMPNKHFKQINKPVEAFYIVLH